MTTPSSSEIAEFLRKQYQLWNEQKFDEMLDYFRRMAPDGFTIEYVGGPIMEGEPAMKAMIADHGGKVSPELLQLLVNGHEAATYVNNRRINTGDGIFSIETYHFADGKLHVRYFHEVAEQA